MKTKHPGSTDSSAIRAGDDPVAASLIEAAVRTMSAKGYFGTSVRDIAAAADVSVGTLYNHFGSKHDLLALILNRGMDDLVAGTEDALYRATASPADRLAAITGVHVRIHAASPRESLLGNSELRSLEPAARELIVSKRDAQQRMFDRVLADGAEQGVFDTATPIDAARFIVSACTAVATWFRSDGPLTVDEVVARYQTIALNTAGYRGAP